MGAAHVLGGRTTGHLFSRIPPGVTRRRRHVCYLKEEGVLELVRKA